MTSSHIVAGASPLQPAVRKIALADLYDSLKEGIDDFWAMPTHVIFLSLIYPIVGLMLARLAFGYDVLPLLFPIAAGFALVGPFAAVGLYEMSRRREAGLDVAWRNALDVRHSPSFGAILAFGYDVLPLLFPIAAGFALVGPFAAVGLYEMSRRREAGLDVAWRNALDVRHSPSFGAILALGALLTVVFLVWVAVAQAIYVASFGYAPIASMPDFAHDVIATKAGWKLILVGNAVGFLFAVLVLTVSVVSFPLLLDRDVGAASAVLTSVRAVAVNPVPMAAWGLIVAALLAIGSIPFLFGLAVVMPVLGHATWHLYRRVVV